MSGWTPAFDSIYTGTLYGKWPTAAVWASLLPLADKHGEINMSFEAIAGMTGWPLELLRQGIDALAQPDPHSRSIAEDGRRLVPLNGERGWGWRVVNHALYREKARLMSKSAQEVQTGKNATRMIDRRKPPPTAADPLSDADSNSNSNKNPSLRSGGRARARGARRVPENFEVTEAMREWARSEAPDTDVDAETKKFRDHQFREARSDWVATWRQWMRRAPEFQRGNGTRKPHKPSPTTAELEAQEAARAVAGP